MAKIKKSDNTKCLVRMYGTTETLASYTHGISWTTSWTTAWHCQKLNLHIRRDSTFLFPVAAEPLPYLPVLLPCKHPVLLMVQESSSSLWALQFIVGILCGGGHLLGLAKLQALPPTPKCCISYCLNWPEPSCAPHRLAEQGPPSGMCSTL